MSHQDIKELKALFDNYVIHIFGLSSSEKKSDISDLDELMKLILEIRNQSKENKDWVTADKIRAALNNLNIDIKDTKDGAVWNYKK